MKGAIIVLISLFVFGLTFAVSLIMACFGVLTEDMINIFTGLLGFSLILFIIGAVIALIEEIYY